MIATIHKEPEFSELFMSYLLTRNSWIEEDLIDQLFFVGVEFSPVLSCQPAPKGISRGVGRHHRRQCFSPWREGAARWSILGGS
jgi:hypothetical protein